MRTKEVAVSLFAIIAGILLVRHGLQPACPVNMPAGSHFVKSGYDLLHNQPKGNWIACNVSHTEKTNFCRVTDDRGDVLFQGDFLPLRSKEPLPADQLQVAEMNVDHLFVQGPAENAPVPVIKLENGALLVPAGDNEALADRWTNNPEELRQIEE